MKVLFLDNRKISFTRNTVLELGKVEKDRRNPLFFEEPLDSSSRPWEVRYDNGYANVLYDEEDRLYKCWYTLFIRDRASEETPAALRPQKSYLDLLDCNAREMGVCYAISEDGIHWQKPSLDIISFNGSKDNNIVMRNAHGAGVFIDHGESRRDRRYKMLLKQGEHQENSMAVSFSPDGINWCAPIPWAENNAAGDCHNNAFWDGQTKKYIGFTRQWEDGIRIAARTESMDFIHWSPPVKVLRGCNPDDQVYSMPVFPYRDIYIGLPSIYRSLNAEKDADTVHCELAWSPDTLNWHRVCPGESLIPRGAGHYPNGDHDCGCIYASASPVVKEDTINLYYFGSNGLHTAFREGSFHLATIGSDRFAGYRPVHDKGPSVLQTVGLPFSGKAITLNAEIAHGGWIMVGILDCEGNNMPGYESQKSFIASIDGDKVVLKWRGNPPDLSDQKPAVFKFEFYRSKLYAIDDEHQNNL